MVQYGEHATAELLRFLRGERRHHLGRSEPISDVELWAVERELGTRLPPSYLAFVRLFGWAQVGAHELFGLPRNRLWGDVVLMNQLSVPTLLPTYVMFSRDAEGNQYYFDLSRKEVEVECPVVVDSTEKRTVAGNFSEFLYKVAFGEIPKGPGTPGERPDAGTCNATRFRVA